MDEFTVDGKHRNICRSCRKKKNTIIDGTQKLPGQALNHNINQIIILFYTIVAMEMLIRLIFLLSFYVSCMLLLLLLAVVMAVVSACDLCL